MTARLGTVGDRRERSLSFRGGRTTNSGLPTLFSSWGSSPLPLGEGQGEGAFWLPGVNMPVYDTSGIASRAATKRRRT